MFDLGLLLLLLMIVPFEDRFWICLAFWIIIRGFGLGGCLGWGCGLVTIAAVAVVEDGVRVEVVFGGWALDFRDVFAMDWFEGTAAAIAAEESVLMEFKMAYSFQFHIFQTFFHKYAFFFQSNY